MSEETQRFRDFCSAFSVEFLKLTDSFLIWALPVILFLLVFIGNTLWGLTGVILSVLFIFVITMSYLYFNLWKSNKKPPKESTASATPKFTVSYDGQGQNQNHNIQFGNINQRNSRPSVSIRTTTMYQDRYSPRGSASGSLNESESALIPPGDTTGFDESQNREEDLECDDSSTIAEGLGNFRNQQRKALSPSEWSQVTSPGFSSRVVRQAAIHSPLSEYNFRGMNKNQSPFDMSPNGPLKLGEIPFGSRWRQSGRNLAQVPVRDYKLAVSRKREPKENGTVYLKIAPMEGMGYIRNDNSDLDQSNSNETPKISSGLGGISQAGLNNSRYTRLSPSANSTLERSLRMRNTSPPTSSTFNIVEVLSNRKGKRNRGHDSPLEPLSSPRSPSSAISNLSISTDDNPKDSKRVKFIMPPEPNTSRNLSMLPLTSHNNPENGNMTSESILEQMNQTEKRFLPDDDTPPSIRPLPKKGRPSDRGLHGTGGPSSSTSPNSSSSFRKRRASSSVFSMVEEEARGKAPRFCNCTECYEEAAGVSTYVPQQKKIDVPVPPLRRVVKAITCDRSTETDLFTGGTRRVSRNLPLPISKERYDQDKKLHALRLQKILDISLQQFIPASSSGAPQPTFTPTNSVFTSTPSTFTSPFPVASTQADSNSQPIVSDAFKNQSQASPQADSADSRSSPLLPTTTSSSVNNVSSGSSVNTTQSFNSGGNVGQNAGFQTVDKPLSTSSFSGFGSVAPATTAATPILQTTTPVISFGSNLQNTNSEGNKSDVSEPRPQSLSGGNTGMFTFGVGSTSTTQTNVTGSSSSTSGQSSTAQTSGNQSLPLSSSIFGKTANELTTSSPGISTSTSSTSGKESDTTSVGSTASSTSTSTGSTFGQGQSSLFKPITQPSGMFGGQQQSVQAFGSPSVLGRTQEPNKSVSTSGGFGSPQQPQQPTTVSTPSGFVGFNQPSSTNTTNTSTSGVGGFGSQPSQQQPTPAAGFPFGNQNNATSNSQSNSGGLFTFGQPAQSKQESIPPGTSSSNGAQQTSAATSAFTGAPSTFTSPFSAIGTQANVISSSQPTLSSAQQSTTAGSTSFTSGSANNVLSAGSLNTTQSFSSPSFGNTGQDTGFQAFGKSSTTPSFSGFGTVATTPSATSLSQTPSAQISFGSNLQSGANTEGNTSVVSEPQNFRGGTTGLFTFGAGGTQSSTAGNNSSSSGQPSNMQAPGNQFPLNSSIFGKTSSDLSAPSTGLSGFGTSGPRNETTPVGSTTSSTNGSGFAFGQGQSNLFKPATQQSGGIFGGQQQNVPTFGSPTVFGGAQQPNTSSFGSSGFGSPQQPQQPAAASTPSGFGGFNQPSSTSTSGVSTFTFGQPSQLQTPQAVPTGGFGSTGIFGAPLNQQRTAPTGGFGAPLAQTSATDGFGTSLTQTSGTGGFGTSLTQTSGTGGFGAPLSQTSPAGGFGSSLTQQQTSPSGGFGTSLTQQQPVNTGFSFGNPNNAATNLQSTPGLFAFGQTAQPNQGFTFGQGNAAAPAMPAPGANPMFTLGANTTPRRRDARARRYR